jgi:rod shape-determining protein MreB
MAIGKDIGIDLGTTRVQVFVRGKGLVLDEPSVVSIERTSGKMLGVGTEARQMLGRTPGNIAAIKPLHGGVITDYEMTEKMLREMIRKIGTASLFKPRLLICVPGSISEVEERAVIDAGMAAGARNVFLIEASLAAALGSGLDVSQPDGHMVVDIGGGTTDAAVLSLSGIVRGASIKSAGDSFDDAVIRFVKKKHNILIGERTAEDLKIAIGTVYSEDDTDAREAKGRCLLTGLPRVFSISSDDMREAFEEPCERVLEEIQSILENTPPELVADISGNGIMLTGGGALLRGLAKLVEARTNIRTTVAANAESSVVLGMGKALGWLDDMKEGVLNLARKRQIDS